MRGFLFFLVLVAGALYAMGETVGVQLGAAGWTPVWVHGGDGTAVAERRTLRRDDMPITVSGLVREGVVEVRVIYQDPGSFQAIRPPGDPELIHEATFEAGETIELDRTFDEGPGVYRVELGFDAATGLFRVSMPRNADL